MEGSVGFARTRCGRLVRAMTRCECSGVPFAEISRRLAEGRSLDQLQLETGVGLLCTACLPDLRDHVAQAQRDAQAATPRAAAPASGPEPVDPAA
jgi:bacterioferritin-associated ferredoxin